MPPKVKLPLKKTFPQKISQETKNDLSSLDNPQIDRSSSMNSSQSNSQPESALESVVNSEPQIPDQSEFTNSQTANSTTNFPKVELESLQKELEDWKNRTFRLTADLANLTKQEEINLGQTRKSVKKSVISLLLPFLNTLYLSFAFVPTTSDDKTQKFVQTLQKSFQELVQDLHNNGIELLIPASGSPFDPNTMTALNPPESDDNIKIKQVVSLGLRLDNQLIRPVSVML